MEGTSTYISHNPRTTLLWPWRAPQNTDCGRTLALPSVRYIATLSHWRKRNSFTPECSSQDSSLTWILCNTSRLSYLYSPSSPSPKQQPYLESTFGLGNGSKTTVITPISQSQLCIWFTRPLSPRTWSPASHQDELQYVGLPSCWYDSRHVCHLTHYNKISFQFFHNYYWTYRKYEGLIGKIKSYSTWYTWEVLVSKRLSGTAIDWQARIRRSNPAFFPRERTALGSWWSIPSDRPSLSSWGLPDLDNPSSLEVEHCPCVNESLGPFINFELLWKSLETEPFCLRW